MGKMDIFEVMNTIAMSSIANYRLPGSNDSQDGSLELGDQPNLFAQQSPIILSQVNSSIIDPNDTEIAAFQGQHIQKK